MHFSVLGLNLSAPKFRLGSAVAACLTRDRGAAGSSLTGVTALWSIARHIYPSLVLVQPRKNHPCLTERLLTGHKESNQTDKQTLDCILKNIQKKLTTISGTSCFGFSGSAGFMLEC